MLIINSSAWSRSPHAVLVSTARRSRWTSSQGKARRGRSNFGCTGEITALARSTRMRPLANRNRAKDLTVLAKPFGAVNSGYGLQSVARWKDVTRALWVQP